MASYLSEACKGDADQILAAIVNAMRAGNMMALTHEAGLSRPNLYRFFKGERHNLSFRTVLRMLDALGMRIEIRPQGVGVGQRKRKISLEK